LLQDSTKSIPFQRKQIGKPAVSYRQNFSHQEANESTEKKRKREERPLQQLSSPLALNAQKGME
jgi:hypothetical protein